MSSSFQRLSDLNRKKERCTKKDLLFMRDYHLPHYVNYNYSKKRKKTMKTKALYRCVLTGRHNGVLTKYKLTRMAFKSLAGSGLLPGIHKSSW